MNAPIRPEAFSAASIVIQIFLLFIAFITLVFLGRSYSMRAAARSSYSILVAWVLLALVMATFNEDFFSVWRELFAKVAIPAIPRDYSFLAIFLLNLSFTAVLIVKTGGAKRSPFTSILLLLPSLAIFLREPVGRFLFYSVAVGMVYIVFLRVSWRPVSSDYERGEYELPAKSDEAVDDYANTWANMACLVLATLIGYITQP